MARSNVAGRSVTGAVAESLQDGGEEGKKEGGGRERRKRKGGERRRKKEGGWHGFLKPQNHL